MDKNYSRYPFTCKRTGEVVGSYSEYLESNHWKDKKAWYFKLRLPKGKASRSLKKHGRVNIGKCKLCKKQCYALDIHHLTYDHLGKERLQDLVHLCRVCHDLQHLEHKRLPSLSFGEIFKITAKNYRKQEKKITSKGVDKVRKHNKGVKKTKNKKSVTSKKKKNNFKGPSENDILMIAFGKKEFLK